MSNLREETAALLKAQFNFNIYNLPPDDPLVYGFNVAVAYSNACGGSAGDVGAFCLFNACTIRLPLWDTLPIDWEHEVRSEFVKRLMGTVRLYAWAVWIYDSADWMVGIVSREQFGEVRGRLLRLEQLLLEGGWIRKPPDNLSFKVILELPAERVLGARWSFKGLFRSLLGKWRGDRYPPDQKATPPKPPVA